MYFANWLKNSLTSSLILVGIISCVSFAESSALIQTIDAWQWLPPSPDSAGVVYLPTANSLLVADSEVSEMPIFTGDNLFEATLTGDLIKTLTTISFSDEPTGVTFNFSNGHLFFSDDDARSIYELDPGPDGLYDTSDNIITSFSTEYFGSRDPEGVTFANEQGVDVLFIADGVNREVYRVEPGDNGFFDGVDDQVTSFDTAGLGLDDPEGIAFNHDNGNLYVVGRPPNTLFEITTAGALVQTIDISAANAENPAGLAYAPSSSDPNIMSIYIVDRGVDNDSDPNENDGKIYEFSLNAVVQSSDEYIIDNGDAETSSTGIWSRSAGTNYYGRKSVYTKIPDATYTFQTFFPGEVKEMEVHQWWTYWSNRCTSTKIEISDADELLDTFYVNQQQNISRWNHLDTYQFNGGAALRIISEGGCTVNADAVKFVSAGGDPPTYECSDGTDNDGDGLTDYPADPGCSSTTDDDEYNAPPTYECSDGTDNDGDGLTDYPADPGCASATDNDEYNAPSSDEYIIDNLPIGQSGSGIAFTGSWMTSNGTNYYGNKSVFASASGATYTFQTFFPGEVMEMDVHKRWTYWGNRCTSTKIEIYDADGLLDTFYVNQKENVSNWNYLDTYQFNGGAALRIISEGGCTVNADAVKFVSTGGVPPTYECSDGTDNDGDGFTDYPADPGCASATDNDEYNAPPTYECSDGTDNDGDGFTDYPDDPGCASATDNDEFNAPPSYECSDGTDNDGDGFTDYPADPGCASATDNDEYNAPSSDEYTLDNGDAETSSTGSWSNSSGTNYYGRKSVFASASGAAYTFQIFFPGELREMDVYQWWTYWGNRCTDTKIEIFDADGLLDTFYVNQKENVSNWNYLDTYQFNGGAALRIISEGGCTVNADAVKFVSTGGVPPTYECSDGTDNDGDGLTDYPADPGCTSATDNDEYNAPPTYECSDGTDNDGDGLTDYPADPGCASAADNDEYNAPSSDEYIIDNGDAETSSTGSWSNSSGTNYYGRKSVFASASGATYTFQIFFPGELREMDVYQWWTYWGNRCTDTKIEIYDADGLLDTFYINQMENESQWNYLGTYEFNGGAALRIISEGGCTVNADAVKFESFIDSEHVIVTMGDSITAGTGDDDPSDGVSYQPVLDNLLTAHENGITHDIINEGVGGTESWEGATLVHTLLADYPEATRFLVQYGTNDAPPGMPVVPSGKGLHPGDPGYPGTFKDNMQQIIDAVNNAGREVCLAKVPIALGETVHSTPYPDPDNGAKNLVIKEYNEVIDELVSDPLNNITVTPPDFYNYFKAVDPATGRPRYEDQYADNDNLHPNGIGYQSMAQLWFEALTQ